MNIPQNSFLIRFSKFISNLFNPLVSILVYYLYISYLRYSFAEAIEHFLPLVLILMLPIMAWIFWNVRKGNYNNMDVSDRRKRNSLYIVIVGLMLLYLIINKLFLQHSINVEILFLLLLLVLMQVSNFFIKSSMHTALNLYTAVLFFAVDPIIGMIWLLITVLVGISRVIVGRHSVKEVLMGGFLATIVSFIYLYTQIQLEY